MHEVHSMRLHELVDGELSSEQADEVRRHVLDCLECQQEIEDILQLSWLHAVAMEQASELDTEPESLFGIDSSEESGDEIRNDLPSQNDPPAQCDLHALDDLPVQDVSAAPSGDVIDLAQTGPRRWRRVAVIGVAAALAVAATVVFTLGRTKKNPSLAGALAAERSLAFRLSDQYADRHRKYNIKANANPVTPENGITASLMLALEHARNYRALTAAYVLQKQYANAEDVLQQAPSDEGRANDLAVIRALQGRHDEALAILDRVLQQHPGYTPALWNRALLLAQLERVDEAADSFDAVAERDRQPGWRDEAQSRARRLRNAKNAHHQTSP